MVILKKWKYTIYLHIKILFVRKSFPFKTSITFSFLKKKREEKLDISVIHALYAIIPSRFFKKKEEKKGRKKR